MLKTICSVAQARTGTGKTLAFLVPVLQNIISDDPSLERKGYRRDRPTTTDIRAIIISPTRELAEQIATEARKVAQKTDVIIQTAVGGTGKNFHLQKMRREGCHILVGTPGRLNDILSDSLSGVRAPKLSAFVLDEADRLLDQGFRPEIENIQNILPNRNDVDRQTLLFSATVPEEVMSIVKRTAKPDFKFLRTVKEGEQQTHEKVPQKIVSVGGFENIMPALVELCKREIARTDGMPFKAIVYFAATAEVGLAAAIFQNLRQPGQSVFSEHPLHPAKIIHIHGKLTQSERTRAAEAFRRATSAILLSSDVTARGMDFPNVTHVIQIGVPSNRDTYIHRIGRTARGDKQGEGWLLATNLELREARYRLQNLPLVADTSLETPKVDMTKDAQLPESTAKTLTQVVEASRMVGPEVKAAAYMACLGVYSWLDDKRALIDAMNTRSKYCWGMPVPPAISPILSKKLGLSQVPGINIGSPRFDVGFTRRPPIGGGYGSRGRDSTQFGSSDRGGSYGSRGSRPGGDFRDRGGFGRDRDSGGFSGRGRGSYGQDRGGYGRDRDSGYSGRGRSEGGDREPFAKF